MQMKGSVGWSQGLKPGALDQSLDSARSYRLHDIFRGGAGGTSRACEQDKPHSFAKDLLVIVAQDLSRAKELALVRDLRLVRGQQVGKETRVRLWEQWTHSLDASQTGSWAGQKRGC